MGGETHPLARSRLSELLHIKNTPEFSLSYLVNPAPTIGHREGLPFTHPLSERLQRICECNTTGKVPTLQAYYGDPPRGLDATELARKLSCDAAVLKQLYSSCGKLAIAQ